MTVGIRAGRLIPNGGDESEHPIAARLGKDARQLLTRRVWASQAVRSMAAHTCFGVHVNGAVNLPGNRGKNHLTRLVVYPYSFDPRLTTEGSDDIVDVFLPVEKHAVVRRTSDQITDAVRADDDVVHQVVLLDAQCCKSQRGQDDGLHRDYEEEEPECDCLGYFHRHLG